MNKKDSHLFKEADELCKAERYNNINKILINLLNGHQEISIKIIYSLMKSENYGKYMINNQIKSLHEEYYYLISRKDSRKIELTAWPTKKTPLYKFILIKSEIKKNIDELVN